MANVSAAKELLKVLNCNKCNRLLSAPVRISRCGHYFCKKCLDTNSTCYKCGQAYNNEELDFDVKFFKKVKPLLPQLHKKLKKRIPPRKTPITGSFCVRFVGRVPGRRNSKGETELHTACRRKNALKVRQLINRHCDVNAVDYAGWTPLHEAVVAKSLDITRILLESGALVNVAGEYYITPLHKAALAGNVELIELLLKYRANTEALDYYGEKAVDCTDKNEIKELFEKKVQVVDSFPTIIISTQIVVYCHSIDNMFVGLVRKHSIKCKESFSLKSGITHLIVKRSHKTSTKILLSMLHGLTIVPQEWLHHYIKGNHMIYWKDVLRDMPDLSRGIRKAMINRLLRRPKLFDGMQFYIEDHTIQIEGFIVNKEFLNTLITTGGGKVLHRAPTPRIAASGSYFPYHSQNNQELRRCCYFIIFNEASPPLLQYKMAELKHKSSKWLIDCVKNFTLY